VLPVPDVSPADHRNPVMTVHLPGGDPEPDRKEKRMSERVAIVTGVGGELGQAAAGAGP
jgi:hypothetical protein